MLHMLCLPDSGFQDPENPEPPFSHLVGHEVGEQHHVPPVDAHAVVDHRVLDLVDDGCPGSLNAQSLLHLERAE